jgi:hypothetical protein
MQPPLGCDVEDAFQRDDADNLPAGGDAGSGAAFLCCLFIAGGRRSRHVESMFRPERTQWTVRSITSTRSTAARCQHKSPLCADATATTTMDSSHPRAACWGVHVSLTALIGRKVCRFSMAIQLTIYTARSLKCEKTAG